MEDVTEHTSMLDVYHDVRWSVARTSLNFHKPMLIFGLLSTTLASVLHIRVSTQSDVNFNEISPLLWSNFNPSPLVQSNPTVADLGRDRDPFSNNYLLLVMVGDVDAETQYTVAPEDMNHHLPLLLNDLKREDIPATTNAQFETLFAGYEVDNVLLIDQDCFQSRDGRPYTNDS
jgi:hypothetical protein